MWWNSIAHIGLCWKMLSRSRGKPMTPRALSVFRMWPTHTVIESERSHTASCVVCAAFLAKCNSCCHLEGIQPEALYRWDWEARIRCGVYFARCRVVRVAPEPPACLLCLLGFAKPRHRCECGKLLWRCENADSPDVLGSTSFCFSTHFDSLGSWALLSTFPTSDNEDQLQFLFLRVS